MKQTGNYSAGPLDGILGATSGSGDRYRRRPSRATADKATDTHSMTTTILAPFQGEHDHGRCLDDALDKAERNCRKKGAETDSHEKAGPNAGVEEPQASERLRYPGGPQSLWAQTGPTDSLPGA